MIPVPNTRNRNRAGAYWHTLRWFQVGENTPSSLFGLFRPALFSSEVSFMEANTGKGDAPSWHALYEAAVLELDPAKIPARIAKAQRAVMDRMADLNRSGDGVESQALMNALNVLRDPRKMADDGNGIAEDSHPS
jgi:hypothetical protein